MMTTNKEIHIENWRNHGPVTIPAGLRKVDEGGRMTSQAQFEQKLRAVGLPFEQLRVFGTIRVNVHVITIGEDTARKWASLLAKIFPDVRVRMVPTVIYNQVNTNTCLKPSTHGGWLIAVGA